MALNLNQNPLDDFRSYSYHFILAIGPTTEDLKKLIGPSSGGQSKFLANIEKAELGEKIPGADNCHLLIDTRRFSQFSVTDLEMLHVYGTGRDANPSAPLAETKMRILDSTGLSFFNFVKNISAGVFKSTNPFYLLGIVFVGHNYNGTTEIISTSFIPLIMILMGFEFKHTGSVIDIQFMEIDASPGQGIPAISSLADLRSITTEEKSNTLGDALQTLENALNENSIKYYSRYSNEAMKKNGGKSAGKLVQYMITWPSEWANFSMDHTQMSKYTEQVFVARGEPNKKELPAQPSPKVAEANSQRNASIAFSREADIPTAIKTILEKSNDYLRLADAKQLEKRDLITAKILTNVTSDDTSIIVHYDIFPYIVKKPDSDPNVRIADDVLKYDYIFTGKNKDIIDLKIIFPEITSTALFTAYDMGPSRMARNANDGIKNSKDPTQINPNTGTDFDINAAENDPIFPPRRSQAQSIGFGHSDNGEDPSAAVENVRLKQEHKKALANMHFIGSLGVSMTVRGNPQFIQKFANIENKGAGIPAHHHLIGDAELAKIRSSPDGITDSILTEIKTAKSMYIKTHVNKKIVDKDVATSGVYATINIRAPNVNSTTGEPTKNSENPLYTDEFFYGGYYLVLYVKTMFDGGSFKHDLELIPMDPTGTMKVKVKS